MAHGIICIETEWQLTKKGNRRNLNSEPLMKFISESNKIKYIYKQVATRGELEYYLKQFRKKEYSGYDILYFNFHGETHLIQLEGEKEGLTLDELQKIGGNVFEDRFVHFSSCRTLLGSENDIERFKNESKAKIVSGYRKSVDTYLSAVHDIALIGAYIKYSQKPAIFKHMSQLYGELEEKLGFKYFM